MLEYDEYRIALNGLSDDINDLRDSLGVEGLKAEI